MPRTPLATFAAITLLLPHAQGASVLLNNGFESFSVRAGNYNSAYNVTTNPDGYLESYSDSGAFSRQYLETATAMGWDTTASDARIELWESGFLGVNAPEGSQFAEINATQNAALFQDVTIDVSGAVDFSFYHRGRSGNDTLAVTITYFGLDNTFGTGDDVQLVNKQYTTGNSAWVQYTENDQFTSVAGGLYRFSYSAVSSAGGNLTFGNFIDDARFGVDAVPEPSAALLGAFGVFALIRRRRA